MTEFASQAYYSYAKCLRLLKYCTIDKKTNFLRQKVHFAAYFLTRLRIVLRNLFTTDYPQQIQSLIISTCFKCYYCNYDKNSKICLVSIAINCLILVSCYFFNIYIHIYIYMNIYLYKCNIYNIIYI